MSTLRKRIFQWCPAIAYSVGTNILRAVEMAQCHIVEVFEHVRVYVICTAYGEFFRLTGSCASDELVGQKHIAGAFIQRHVLYRRANGVGVAFDTCLRIKPSYMGGLHKGQ